MSLRLCIFGNSHVAALRAALGRYEGRWAPHRIDTVGAHGMLLSETAVRDGVLVPLSDAARDAFARFGGGAGVRLADYDALAIAGCQVTASRQMPALNRAARWPALPSLTEVPDLATMPETLISTEAARASVTATVMGELGPRFARTLRRATRAPIFYLSQPRLSARGADGRNGHVRALMRAERRGDGAALSDMFEDWVEDAMEEAGLIWLPQPSGTLASPLTTKARFGIGAPRLAETPDPQPEGDVIHANAVYGRLVLDQLVAAAQDEVGAPA